MPVTGRRWLGPSQPAGIRARLIVLTVLAALPIIAMAAIIAWQNYQAIAHGAQERATLLDGRVLAQVQATEFESVSAIEQALPLMRPGRCSPPPPPPGTSLVLFDPAGHITCVAGNISLPTGARPAWLDQQTGGRAVLARWVGPGEARLVVALRGPGGGVLAQVVPQTRFARAALPLASQPGEATWLLDDARTVLASTGDVVQALPSLPTMIELIASRQTSRRALSSAGLWYAYATTALPNGWRLITATSARREVRAARRALAVQLAELSALLLIGFVAVVLGADVAFGQPLRRLSGAVRCWQGGGAFKPGDLRGAPLEIRQLASSFEESVTVLRHKGEELNRAQTQQNLLIMEVHHRVKNNLQVIASLLNLQASRIRLPEARAEFQAARDRIRALATLHRHLYADGELHTINMPSFLNELCAQLLQAMGEQTGGRIQVVIDAPELRLSSDQAVPLALIVTEAVTNSVRYAFPGGRPGRIEVSLAETPSGLDLHIGDDGVGIQTVRAEPASGQRDGIGLKLIRGFARQLGATLAVTDAPGTRYHIRLHAGTEAPRDDAAGGGLDEAAVRPDMSR